MSRKVEPILVTRQKIIILPKAELTIVEGVHVVVRVKYNEPRFNHHNENIIKRVPRDWSKEIHSVNRIPRPNSPHCTYCHQIGH
jgi:hypothetical protein